VFSSKIQKSGPNSKSFDILGGTRQAEIIYKKTNGKDGFNRLTPRERKTRGKDKFRASPTQHLSLLLDI
jgi:hypothetical protein